MLPRHIILIFSLLFIPSMLPAQEDDSKAETILGDTPMKVTIDDKNVEVLSGQDAVAIALKNNYSIQIAKDEAQIAANNNTAGNAGMLPNITANASAEKEEYNSETWNANVQLDWTLFDGFKMFATRNKLRELEKLGTEAAISKIQDTVALVLVQYYDIISLTKGIESIRENLAISKIRLEQAEEKYKYGGSSRPERLSALVDYNADKTTLFKLLESLQSAKIRLNNLLSRDPNTAFNVASEIDYNHALTYDEIRNMAVTQSPSIIMARLNTSIAEYALKESKSAYYPEFGVHTAYNATKDNQRPDGWSAGVRLSYDIFDGFERQRLERNAYLQLKIAGLSEADIRKTIDAEVADYYNTYTINLKLVKLEEENIDVAKENMEVSLESYKVGAIPAIELRESQRNYLNAVNNLISAQYQVKIAEIALLQIIGKIALQYNITLQQ